MPELGPVMRALELQRLLEDKVSEWRERSARVAGASVADSYQQPLNFKRHTNRRKNSAEINRIIAKYSKPNKRTVEPMLAPINNVQAPPQRPVRHKKIQSNLKLSKSEDNLVQATIMDHPDPSSEVKSRFDFSKYSARSCEDITAFVDIDRNKKSKHFEENSIFNEKIVTKDTLPKRLHSISEDGLDTPDLKDSGTEVRTSNFATSTPISRRRPVSENVAGFQKCSKYSSVDSALRKGSSEPDILSVSPSEESLGTVDSKKTSKSRWKLLKPPFRKGTLDCLIRWRGKKQRTQETSAARHSQLLTTSYRNMHLLKKQAFINGEWVNAANNAVFPVTNPADDSVIAEVPDMDAKDAKLAVDVASKTLKTWRDTTAKERSAILRKWNDLCLQNIDHLAEVLTAESGKPLAEAKGEVLYGASFLEWFADSARHVNGEIIPSPWRNKQILVTRHALGVVSVITPWNFPFAMITRKVAALMAAGCTCVIKPSEDTPLTALAAVELANQAGVPKGVINVVTTNRNNAAGVGKVMCEDPAVGCISFTGSTHVGRILYSMAAKGIKRVSLELGGNAPFIVFPSADMENAIDQAMLAKFRNNGQACVGANRFLIHESVFDKFVESFKSRIGKKCILGPGNKEGVTCGPLINKMQADKVSGLVNDAVSKGAKILLGGKFAKELGTKFYESTLLVDVKPDMEIYKEEVFGPVAVCYKFKDEAEALEVANSTTSGLAAYVFTKDLGQAFRMSQKLEFGMVAINDGILSATEAPFGGIKESGIGREGSMHGVEEYTDIKYTLISGLDK